MSKELRLPKESTVKDLKMLLERIDENLKVNVATKDGDSSIWNIEIHEKEIIIN